MEMNGVLNKCSGRFYERDYSIVFTMEKALCFSVSSLWSSVKQIIKNLHNLSREAGEITEFPQRATGDF